jgi:hypothetical protein
MGGSSWFAYEAGCHNLFVGFVVGFYNIMSREEDGQEDQESGKSGNF